MVTDLIHFLTKYKTALFQHSQKRLNHLFGDSTEEWTTWLLESFCLTLAGKQYAGCKFADENYALAESVQIFDEAALVLRDFIFSHTDHAESFGKWSQAIDYSFIKMRQNCLNAVQPEVASTLFSDIQLICIFNRISQDMLQEHTEHGIFDVISKGLSELGLYIAVFKISSDFSTGELHFSDYSNSVNQHFIHFAGVERSAYYQFKIPRPSRLDTLIRDQGTEAFFPNDELLACLFNKDDQATIKQFQQSMGSTKTILASGRVNSKLQAVLAVSGDQLTEKEVPAVSIFANQLAIAMQNAALYQEADQRAEQLAGLNALAKITATEHSVSDVFTQAVPILRSLLDFDRFSLSVKMEDGYHVYSIHEQVDQYVVPLFEYDRPDYFNHIIREGGSRIVNDICGLEPFVKKKLSEKGFRSIMICPVISGGSSLGTIILGKKILNAFHNDDLETLDLVVDQLAPLIDKAILYRRIQESEARFRTFYEQAAVGISIYDWRKKIWEPNSAFIQMLGYDQDDVEILNTLTIEKIKHPEDMDKQKDYFPDLLSGKIKMVEDESRCIKKDGDLIWTKSVISMVRDSDTQKPIYTIVILEDITERKRIEAAVLESKRKYKTLFEVSMDAIFIMDKDGLIRDANPAAVNMLGWPYEEIQNRPFLSFLPDEDEQEFELLGKRLMYLDIEHLQARFRVASGDILDVEINTRTMGFKENVLQVLVRDITDQRKIERELQFMGSHDMLTGLFNRNYFEIEMSRYCNGRMYPISIIVIDLDGLKITNDINGHSAGDKLLQQTAQVLRSVFRAEDIVARWGGDEFAILLPLVDEGAANAIVCRIQNELKRFNRGLPEMDAKLSFSIGAATAVHGENLDDTLKQADAAMYHEKRLKYLPNPMLE